MFWLDAGRACFCGTTSVISLSIPQPLRSLVVSERIDNDPDDLVL